MTLKDELLSTTRRQYREIDINRRDQNDKKGTPVKKSWTDQGGFKNKYHPIEVKLYSDHE